MNKTKIIINIYKIFSIKNEFVLNKRKKKKKKKMQQKQKQKISLKTVNSKIKYQLIKFK
jgi:hypothetical protein